MNSTIDIATTKTDRSIRKIGIVYVFKESPWRWTMNFLGGKDMFEKRSAVLHPTLLSIFPHSKNISPEEITALTQNSSRETNKANVEEFLLAPMGEMMVVTQVGDLYLTLALHNTKKRDPNGDIKNISGRGSSSKDIQQIKLRFSSKQERDEWAKDVVSECQKNHMVQYFTNWLAWQNADATRFVSLLNEEIWGRIILSISDFRALRIIMTFVPDNPEFQIVQNVIRRCLHWVLKLLNNKHYDESELCKLFLSILCPALDNYLFRTILFLIEPDNKFLDDYKARYPPKESKKVVEECLKRLATEVNSFQGEHYFFLHILKHPLAPHLNPASGEYDIDTNFNLNNRDELDWQNKCTPYTFSWEMVEDILAGAAAFSFHLIMGFMKDTIDDLIIEKILDFLGKVPKRYFITTFKSIYTAIPQGKHFISLLQYCRYRETWKIFCLEYLKVDSNLDGKPFIDAVHMKLWTIVIDGRYKSVTEMFTPSSISSNFENYKFINALHGELLTKLIRNNLHVAKAYSIDSFLINNQQYEANGSPHLPTDHVAQLNLFSTGLSSVLLRLKLWILNITGEPTLKESDADLFVELLIAIINSAYFRAFVMLFLPSSMVLDGSVKHNKYNDDNKMVDVKVEIVNDIAKMIDDLNSPQFHSFLTAAEYPSARVEECTWAAETEWYKLVEHQLHPTGPWLLDWDQMKTVALTNTPAAAFMVVMKRYQHDNFLESIRICASMPRDVILANFKGSFKYEAMVSGKPTFNDSWDAKHFLSFINFCHVRHIWELLIASQRISSISNLSTHIHRELWQALENSRCESEANHGLQQLFSCQLIEPPQNNFGVIIPMWIANRVATGEQPTGSIVTMLQQGCEDDAKWINTIPDMHVHHFKKFLDHVMAWLLTFMGDSPSKPISVYYANLLGACVLNPIVRALLVVCNPDFGIGNYVIENIEIPLHKLFWESLESILRKDSSAYEMEQALLFSFSWCKHPFVHRLRDQSLVMIDGPWDEELLWISEWAARPWRLDFREFQRLIQKPSCFPFKIVSRDFNSVGDTVIDKLLEEHESVPIILRKHSFKYSIKYLPYGIGQGVDDDQESFHFDNIVQFALFREVWRLFMTQTLDPEAGNAFFARSVIAHIWQHITTTDGSILREFFLPKSSDTIWMKATFRSILQRRCMTNNAGTNEQNQIRLKKLLKSAGIRPGATTVARLSGDSNINLYQSASFNTDLSSLHLLVNQICEWTTACSGGKKKLEPSDTQVFHEIIHSVIQDVGFRAFISKFLPSDDCVASFGGSQEYTLYQSSSPAVGLVMYIANSLRSPSWFTYRRFMDTLGHPSKHNGSSPSDEEEPLWNDESIWLAQILTQNDIILSWSQLKLCFEPTPYLIWLIASHSHESSQIEALQSVLPTDLNAMFSIVQCSLDSDNNRVEILSRDHHFIALCLEDDGVVFSLFLLQKQITNEFFEALVRFAFRDDLSPKTRRLSLIMKDIMFQNGDVTKEYNVVVLSTIPSIGRIIVEEIYKAITRSTFRRDVSTLCEIMAIILRLEGIRNSPISKKVGTQDSSTPNSPISKKFGNQDSFTTKSLSTDIVSFRGAPWTTQLSTSSGTSTARNLAQSAGDNLASRLSNVNTISELMVREPEFQRKFFDILREINFIKWLAKRCDRNKGLFGPARAETSEKVSLPLNESRVSFSNRTEPSSLKNSTRRSFLQPLVATFSTSRCEIEASLLNFFQICVEFQPISLRDFLIDFGPGRPFFITYFHQHEPFRFQLLQSIIRVLNISSNSTLKQYLENGYFLYDNDHMNSVVLECIGLPGRGQRRSSSSNINEQQFAELMTVALYLHNLDNLKARIEKILDWLLQDDDRLRMTETLLRWMIDVYIEPDLGADFSMQRVRWKQCQHFSSFTLEDLVDCAQQATIATQLLRGSESTGGYQSLETLFYYYFTKCKPSLWRNMFAQSKTIAYFIKYVDREDLRIAFAKFAEINTGNRRYLFHLNRVKKVLSSSIVSASELVTLTTNHSKHGRDNIDKFLDSLLQSANNLDPSQFDLKIVIRLTAVWMKVSLNKIQIPLPPRNAQLITLLSCASWAKCLLIGKDETQGKALIAQVGTGEGKSLIIAMMAIYFVKVIRKRVHILENNLGLLEKDFEQLQPFYREFNIIPRGGRRSSMEMPDLTKTSLEALNTKDCRNEFADFGVTYCLRRNMERYHQDCIMNNIQNPFSNTVLIVDEVDDLIVDDAPNQPFACRDIEEPEFIKACQFYKTKGIDAEGGTTFLWELAQDAGRTASEFTENEDYVRHGDNFFLLDDRQRPLDVYDYRLEYLKPQPKLRSNYYFQSIPYMLSQYECITGFSGSLGSPSEREYLEKQYKAWCFDTPSFLNTCKDVMKIPPQLMDDPVKRGVPCVHVMPSSSDQIRKIVQIAARMHIRVPVLIIGNSTAEAYLIAQEVEEYLRHTPHSGCDEERGILDGMDAKDYVQLFLQYVKDTMIPDKENWSRIISRATTRLEDRFPITITDPFGGRGHDFDVHDDSVESYGGLAVIVTSIPASDREWRQWKGRTGRRDNSGQYAVVLSLEDPLIKQACETGILRNCQCEAAQETTRYSEKLITQLLELQDNSQKEKLRNLEKTIYSGRRLNRLCDSFYLKFGAMQELNWPKSNNERKLRNLLTNPMTLMEDGEVSEAFASWKLQDLQFNQSMLPFFAQVESDPEDESEDDSSDEDEGENNSQEVLLQDDYDVSLFLTNPTAKVISTKVDYACDIVSNRVKEVVSSNVNDEQIDGLSKVVVKQDNQLDDKTRKNVISNANNEAQIINSDSYELDEFDEIKVQPRALRTILVNSLNNLREAEYPSLVDSSEPGRRILQSKTSTYERESEQIVDNQITPSNDIHVDRLNDVCADALLNTCESSLRAQTKTGDIIEPLSANQQANFEAVSSLTNPTSFQAVVSTGDQTVPFPTSPTKIELPADLPSSWTLPTETTLGKRGKGLGKGRQQNTQSSVSGKDSTSRSDKQDTRQQANSSKHLTNMPASNNRIKNQAGGLKDIGTVREPSKVNETLILNNGLNAHPVVHGVSTNEVANMQTADYATDIAAVSKLVATTQTSNNGTSKQPAIAQATTIDTSKQAANSQSTSAVTSKQASSNAQVITSNKAAASLASASKRLKSSTTLSELRIGETKKIVFNPTAELNHKLSFLTKGGSPEPLMSSLTDQNGTSIVNVEIQGIIQRLSMSYSIILITKVVSDDLQFNMSLYGAKKVSLSCRGVEVMNQSIEVKPSLSVIPFASYTFHNGTNDTQLTTAGKVMFSVESDSSLIRTMDLSTDEIHFPMEFPNSIVHITQDIDGYIKKNMKHIYYKGDVNHECSRVFLSPNDLVEGEWRVILKWKEAPKDLDLFCRRSEPPIIVYFGEKNKDGRNDPSKGNVELDIDVRTGKGPETITFTPDTTVHYRFVVHNYSYAQDKRAIPLRSSGAKVTLFKSTGESVEFSVPEDIVVNENDEDAEFWHVFDVINGEIKPYNVVTVQHAVKASLDETF